MVKIAHTKNFLDKINEKINLNGFICLKGNGIHLNGIIKNNFRNLFNKNVQVVPGGLFGGNHSKILDILKNHQQVIETYIKTFNDIISEQEILHILTSDKNVKYYENVFIEYNKALKPSESEDRGRFKLLKEGDPFPINDQNPPKVTWIAGHRFNRFIIPSELLKKLTVGKEEKIIKFQIGCVNPSNYRGGYWGFDCHKGIGSFVVYRIGIKNNTMTVLKSSGILTGKTPGQRDQFIDLFEYNLCDDNISNLNKDVFSSEAIKSVVGENG